MVSQRNSVGRAARRAAGSVVIALGDAAPVRQTASSDLAGTKCRLAALTEPVPERRGGFARDSSRVSEDGGERRLDDGQDGGRHRVRIVACDPAESLSGDVHAGLSGRRPAIRPLADQAR